MNRLKKSILTIVLFGSASVSAGVYFAHENSEYTQEITNRIKENKENDTRRKEEIITGGQIVYDEQGYAAAYIGTPKIGYADGGKMAFDIDIEPLAGENEHGVVRKHSIDTKSSSYPAIRGIDPTGPPPAGTISPPEFPGTNPGSFHNSSQGRITYRFVIENLTPGETYDGFYAWIPVFKGANGTNGTDAFGLVIPKFIAGVGFVNPQPVIDSFSGVPNDIDSVSLSWKIELPDGGTIDSVEIFEDSGTDKERVVYSATNKYLHEATDYIIEDVTPGPHNYDMKIDYSKDGEKNTVTEGIQDVSTVKMEPIIPTLNSFEVDDNGTFEGSDDVVRASLTANEEYWHNNTSFGMGHLYDSSTDEEIFVTSTNNEGEYTFSDIQELGGKEFYFEFEDNKSGLVYTTGTVVDANERQLDTTTVPGKISYVNPAKGASIDGISTSNISYRTADITYNLNIPAHDGAYTDTTVQSVEILNNAGTVVSGHGDATSNEGTNIVSLTGLKPNTTFKGYKLRVNWNETQHSDFVIPEFKTKALENAVEPSISVDYSTGISNITQTQFDLAYNLNIPEDENYETTTISSLYILDENGTNIIDLGYGITPEPGDNPLESGDHTITISGLEGSPFGGMNKYEGWTIGGTWNGSSNGGGTAIHEETIIPASIPAITMPEKLAPDTSKATINIGTGSGGWNMNGPTTAWLSYEITEPEETDERIGTKVDRATLSGTGIPTPIELDVTPGVHEITVENLTASQTYIDWKITTYSNEFYDGASDTEEFAVPTINTTNKEPATEDWTSEIEIVQTGADTADLNYKFTQPNYYSDTIEATIIESIYWTKPDWGEAVSEPGNGYLAEKEKPAGISTLDKEGSIVGTIKISNLAPGNYTEGDAAFSVKWDKKYKTVSTPEFTIEEKEPAVAPDGSAEVNSTDQVSANLEYTFVQPSGNPDVLDTVVSKATLTGKDLGDDGVELNLIDNDPSTADIEGAQVINGLTPGTEYTDWTISIESNYSVGPIVISVPAFETLPKTGAEAPKGYAKGIAIDQSNAEVEYRIDVPQGSDTVEKTEIKSATLYGTDIPLEGIELGLTDTDTSTPETIDGKKQVSGLKYGTNYNDWTILVESNAPDAIITVGGFTTVDKGAALEPTLTGTVNNITQNSADVTYSITSPEETNSNYGTKIDSIVLTEKNSLLQTITINDPTMLTTGDHLYSFTNLSDGTNYSFDVKVNWNGAAINQELSFETLAKANAEQPIVTATATAGLEEVVISYDIDNFEGDYANKSGIVSSIELVADPSLPTTAIVPTFTITEGSHTATVSGLEKATDYGNWKLAIKWTEEGNHTDKTFDVDLGKIKTVDKDPALPASINSLTVDESLTTTTTAVINYDINVPEETDDTLGTTITKITATVNGTTTTAPNTDPIGTIEVFGLNKGEINTIEIKVETNAGVITEEINVKTLDNTIDKVELLEVSNGVARFNVNTTYELTDASSELTVNVSALENGDIVDGTATLKPSTKSSGTYEYELDGIKENTKYSNIVVTINDSTDKDEEIGLVMNHSEFGELSVGTITTDSSASAKVNMDTGIGGIDLIGDEKTNKKFPWWIIILLILITLASVGIALFFILKGKNKEENKKAKKTSKA